MKSFTWTVIRWWELCVLILSFRFNLIIFAKIFKNIENFEFSKFIRFGNDFFCKNCPTQRHLTLPYALGLELPTFNMQVLKTKQRQIECEKLFVLTFWDNSIIIIQLVISIENKIAWSEVKFTPCPCISAHRSIPLRIYVNSFVHSLDVVWFMGVLFSHICLIDSLAYIFATFTYTRDVIAGLKSRLKRKNAIAVRK